MKNKYLLFRKINLAIISSLLLSISANAVAQNNNSDAPPVSTTKKEVKKDAPAADKGQKNAEDEIGAYTTRRTNMPPGKAKKVKGGSAKDYAPGQTKKSSKKPVDTSSQKSSKTTTVKKETKKEK